MKKVIILAALAAMTLTACQQDISIEENKPDGAVVFTATTESAPATKTALSYNAPNYDVVWSNGDKITIVDGAGTPNVGVYSTTSTTTHADFTFSSGAEATTPSYKAWYPSDIYNSGTPTLPATQTYAAGNISGSPMYAESSTNNLAFKNICGIIRLNVSTTQSGKKIRRILLSADQGMSGAIENAASLSSADDNFKAIVSGTTGVTLDCGTTGVAISSTATPFHIAVPANTYTTLKITVVTTDGEVQTRTSTVSPGVVVNRSQITDITLGFGNLTNTTGSASITGGGSQEWVQLWAGGPKWAKFNVGSSINSYAGKTDYSTANIGGFYSFNGSDDTAKSLWGPSWITPGRVQLQALIDNCTWIYCDGSSIQYEAGCTLAGWKVSGKDAGYSENSIFLPSSGIKDPTYGMLNIGTRGCYWSSDANGVYGYFLDFVADSKGIPYQDPSHGCSVRAILNPVIDALFSVSSTTKVTFSPGNLQYYCSTSAPKWQFATHQYDYVAFDISAYAANSEKWIDLFAYGTSGYYNSQTNYQPYVVGADESTYYNGNLTGKADWGYNAINNGGNTENIGWRTLTKSEWKYLFSERSNAASKYGHGSINGINGMILLPDSWKLPDGLSFTPGTSAWTNSYTIAQWVLMENAGAIFLPASGSCNSGGIPSEAAQNSAGLYRSSTDAFYLGFNSNFLQVCDASYRQYGDAVRLVKNVN